MMKLMKKVKWKQPTIHWVIGGTLGEKVKNGIFDKDIIGYMDWTIVAVSYTHLTLYHIPALTIAT